MKLITRSMIVATSTVCLASPLYAAVTAAMDEPTGSVRVDPYSWAGFGFFVPAGGNVTVNQLGFWDQGGDGLAVDHTVALFAYAGSGRTYTQLASVTIPGGGSALLDGGFRWISIPDTVLTDNGQNGNYYVVMATQGVDAWTNGAGAMDPAFGTISTGALDLIGEGPIFQINNGSTYGGVNIGHVVPEPSAPMLAALAAFGSFARRRR